MYYASAHICDDTNAAIGARYIDGTRRRFLVLDIGNIAVYPTREQAEALRDAISEALRQEDERLRILNRAYIPTVEEAARHPMEFVDGMSEDNPALYG